MIRPFLASWVLASVVVACSSSDSSGGGSSGTSGATPSAPAPPPPLGSVSPPPPPPPNPHAPPPPAPTPAKGTVGGHSFTVAAGIAYPRTVGSANGYEIFLSDKPIDCNAVTLEGSTTIDVDVQGTPPATATNFMAIDPNVSSIDATHSEADFNVVDATCGSLLSESSKSGNIYFTAFDATHAAGNLSISFGKPGGADDGTITGTFDVPVCAKFPTPACTPH
jgi:hypothetical protein